MDDQLLAMCGLSTAEGHRKAGDLHFELVDDKSGQLDVWCDGVNRPPTRYELKPLSQLYGSGSPHEVFGPQNTAFTPLFMCIEQGIVRHDRCTESLTDGQVSLALDLLAMNPEGDVDHDVLARRLQLDLRLLLSMDDYSRDELRRALRKVRKSVDRHTRLDGRRGYLDFICDYVRV